MRYFSSFAFFLTLILALTCLQSCTGGMGILAPDKIYSPEFLAKIDGVYAIFKDGDHQGAKQKLLAMKDQDLTADEKAKKYNLLGAIEFSQVNYELAAEHFLFAKKSARVDRALIAQIGLNLASTYFKLNKFEFGFEEVKAIELKALGDKEQMKYHQLKFVLASNLGHPRDTVDSLIAILGELKSISEVKNSKNKETLLDNYRSLPDSERVYILENNKSKYPYVSAYLAQVEVEKRYYAGDKSGAKDVLDWLDNEFSQLPEVAVFTKSIKDRMDSFSKMKMSSIGVILPFSKQFERYSNKTLMGIETALSNPKTNDLNLELHVADNKNNPYVAREKVRELILKHHVSVIIGGLFPNTATDEYLEARKYGVVFISIFQVYVPREMKNHLLVELQGSIQSQLAALTKDDVISKFGRKVALFYPKSNRGSSYVDEIWNLRDKKKIDVTNIQNYSSDLKEFREPVRKILGLKFPRERSEELKILKEVYSNEGKQSIRRVQNLPPIVEFDWVFLPSIPNEALQIISFFKYFDAMSGVTFIGGPSWWTSKDLIDEQKNVFRKPIYFVGSDPKEIGDKISTDFKVRNDRLPGLLETLGFEALVLTSNILKSTKPDSRDQLEANLLQLKGLQGISGEFELVDGLWIKALEMLQIRSGKIEKVNLTQNTGLQENQADES